MNTHRDDLVAVLQALDEIRFAGGYGGQLDYEEVVEDVLPALATRVRAALENSGVLKSELEDALDSQLAQTGFLYDALETERNRIAVFLQSLLSQVDGEAETSIREYLLRF